MSGLGLKALSHFKWIQNTYLKFPMDTVLSGNVRTGLQGAIFSNVIPTPLKDPELACYSEDVVTNILQLDREAVGQDMFVKLMCGNETLPGVPCLAHRYGGHQFGSWAGQLGDGRAHLIGEYTSSVGSLPRERWELQLKGSGLTPYSRFADGRAVIRSSVREFVCSEAMHHLGVPTSRAGTLVTSRETVMRDPHYDGRPRNERTAVVLRLAPCWFRFGSLQILAADGKMESLALLADFIAKRYYPDAAALEGAERYSALARGIAVRTASLMARWESVGFTHGVMNTDNMSVLGITIDYGPFGFMDRYDPQFVPNSSDVNGVYRYAHQARIGQWNVCRLWEALMPLMTEEQHAGIQSVLEVYVDEYRAERRRQFATKLGLNPTEAAAKLTTDFLAVMEATGADFTMTFRQLGEVSLDAIDKMVATAQQDCTTQQPEACETHHDAAKEKPALPRCERSPQNTVADSTWTLRTLAASPSFPDWLADYRTELTSQGVSEEDRQSLMCATNPRYILRQWMAHSAAEYAEVGQYDELKRLLRVLERPFTKQEEAEEAGYADPPPNWSCTLSLSCSS